MSCIAEEYSSNGNLRNKKSCFHVIPDILGWYGLNSLASVDVLPDDNQQSEFGLWE